jgi:hypothetical protein
MSRTANPHCHPTRRSLRGWPVVCAAILLASCQPAGVLDPQGPIASAERLLLIKLTAIMLVVVGPVIVATLAFAGWYRSSNTRASRGADESYERAYRVRRLVDPGVDRDLARRVIWIARSNRSCSNASSIRRWLVPEKEASAGAGVRRCVRPEVDMLGKLNWAAIPLNEPCTGRLSSMRNEDF